MSVIHHAIVQCITVTLSELKRSNTTVRGRMMLTFPECLFLQKLDLDDLNVEIAYFKSFDAVVRRQLDPVWHKEGPRTTQLVGDLATLRRLLTCVMTCHDSTSHSLLSMQLPAVLRHSRVPRVPRDPSSLQYDHRDGLCPPKSISIDAHRCSQHHIPDRETTLLHSLTDQC